MIVEKILIYHKVYNAAMLDIENLSPTLGILPDFTRFGNMQKRAVGKKHRCGFGLANEKFHRFLCSL